MHQRVGAGAHGDAVRLQGPQVLGGHVLVIEGDHVAAAREGTQRVQVAIVADDDIADHLRRGVLRGVTEELEPDAEGDARLVGHTGELAAADHADYRERHAPRVSAMPGPTPVPADLDVPRMVRHMRGPQFGADAGTVASAASAAGVRPGAPTRAPEPHSVSPSTIGRSRTQVDGTIGGWLA